MRQEPNNDIDLLLRQLSRRNGAPVSEFDEQHLDADELNSYVANVLPPPARARYTEHLADCSSCRKLVAQLSAAQGPVLAQPTSSVVAPSGWKSFLAGLFSPMVLRYAVPALGLIVVAAVGLLVVRQNRKAESVAELRQTPAPVTRPETAVDPGYITDSLETKPQAADRAEGTSQTGPTAAKGDTKTVAKEAPVAASQPADAVANAAPPPAAPKAAVSQEEAPPPVKLEKQKTDETAAPAAARGVAKQREGEADKNEGKKTDTVAVTPGAVARRDLRVQGARGGTANTAGTGAVEDYKRPAEETKALASAERSKDGDAPTETRSVAGRRFQKRGSVWIDSAYDSSKPITSVGRGSEQYRALVADEPAIATIAQQLPGDIIVVWKGRTYRIR
jgi:hypothetical protein